MNYLARLKQDLDPATSSPLEARPEPFEGFEGVEGKDFSPKSGESLPNFSAKKKEVFKNQFYMEPPKVEHWRQFTAEIEEKRIGSKPSKPSKGYVDDPERWRGQFYLLSASEPCCPGFSASSWRNTLDIIHAFLERHADKAHALGWSGLDLFAVHHTVGLARVDCCGVLMLPLAGPVQSVERDIIQYDRTRFFRVSPSPEMVLVWDFAGKWA